MAFNKKTWKARIAEHPARRILKFVLTGTESVVEVARDEGAVAQDGDAFSAGNMNDLEQRIADGFEAITADNLSGVLQVKNGGTGNASVDTTPTSGSTKMVTSGGVYTALANKTVAASKVTAGTLGGKVNANASAAANITVAQLRDIVGTTTDPGAKKAVSYPNGTVIHVYE